MTTALPTRKMRAGMNGAPELSFHALLRNGLVLAGLLLLGVGLGDAVVGRTKIAQYTEVLASTPAPEPRDRAALFPTASEGNERRAVARAKVGYYQLLFTAGQLLSGIGFVLLVLGVLQIRLRAGRAALRPPVAD